jgi:protein O-GlcNAc transferase
MDPVIQRALQQALQLHQTNRLAEAEPIYRNVLRRHPQEANALNLLGLLCHQTNRIDEAISLLTEAVRFAPHIVACHIHLASALHAKGLLDRAVTHFQRAVEIEPGNAAFHRHLAITLTAVGRVDEAIAHFQSALTLNPSNAEAHYNLGTALMSRAKYNQALPPLLRAAEMDPHNPAVHCNVGAAYRALWKFDEAMKHYRRALELKPDYPDALYNLGALHHALIEVPESIECYRQCLELKPDFQIAHSSMLLAMHYLVPLDAKEIYEQSVKWGKIPTKKLPPRQLSSSSRLKIGYVSADFNQHSVSFFLEPILEHHDRTRFEISCYSSTLQRDLTTKRLAGYVDHFREVGLLPDDRLAELIRQDGIDVLVDLSGHTSHNRLPVFAMKPAPVQATYLGYPNTTGLPEIDYRIVDPIADPVGEGDELYVEKLVRLPRTGWCYKPPSDAPEVSDLPALSNGYVTFGSFNNLTKVNEPWIAVWAEILRRVPSARLLIKSPTLEQEAVRHRLAALFAARGVGEERLEICGRVIAYADHMRTYHRVDIALDTFPYNGTTTTCESMWMGVPVVTRSGEHHVSRVGKSLLTQVGLAELASESEAEYVDRATELADNLQRVAVLRSALRQRMRSSSVMDAPAMALDIERAYEQMTRNKASL